jgi:hypothetical protein
VSETLGAVRPWRFGPPEKAPLGTSHHVDLEGGADGARRRYDGAVLRATTRLSRAVPVAVLLLCAPGCATNPRQPPPESGTVTVGVTATGPIVSTLRVRISIEPAGISEIVQADRGLLTRDGIPPGEHVVSVRDLPAGCRVDGPSERTISIAPQRRSAVLRFHVVCN